MCSQSNTLLRIAAALIFLFWGFAEVLQLAALAPDPSTYSATAHGALALSASCAGLGLWQRAAWSRIPIALCGLVLAGTLLIDAFVLGIRPWLFALLAAVLALIAAVVIATWASQWAPRLPIARE